MRTKYLLVTVLLVSGLALVGCQAGQNQTSSSVQKPVTPPVAPTPTPDDTSITGSDEQVTDQTDDLGLQTDLNELDSLLNAINADDFSGNDLSDQALAE